jgi:hypothetical protein
MPFISKKREPALNLNFELGGVWLKEGLKNKEAAGNHWKSRG